MEPLAGNERRSDVPGDDQRCRGEGAEHGRGVAEGNVCPPARRRDGLRQSVCARVEVRSVPQGLVSTPKTPATYFARSCYRKQGANVMGRITLLAILVAGSLSPGEGAGQGAPDRKTDLLHRKMVDRANASVDQARKRVEKDAARPIDHLLLAAVWNNDP